MSSSERPCSFAAATLEEEDSSNRNVKKASSSMFPSSAAGPEPRPVEVFLRIRPLVEDETGHDKTTIQVSSTKSKLRIRNDGAEGSTSSTTSNNNNNSVFANAPPLIRRSQQRQWKEFKGFTNIYTEEHDNCHVYTETVRPIVERLATVTTAIADPAIADPAADPAPPDGTPKSISEKQKRKSGPSSLSSCVFTYGHTGSGKTHSLLGYPSKNQFGLYRYAVEDLFEIARQGPGRGGTATAAASSSSSASPLEGAETSSQADSEDHQQQPQQQEDNDESNNLPCIWLQVTELYKQKVMDLIEGDECAIKQDGSGKVHVRPPFVEDEEGRKSQRLLGRLCKSPEEVVDCVENAIQRRRVGTSTHHDQSSRSHLMIQMEIVTPNLIQQRQIHSKHKEQLTRLKWFQTERMFGKHKDQPFPKWCDEYMDSKQPSKLRNSMKESEKLVEESEQILRSIESHPLNGNTLVFCDLAGNEFGSDSTDSTKEELEEAAEINKSLLAVKSMLRNLSAKQKHVQYRDSKLTMVLRRYLDTSAIMLAHISPSVESFKKSTNTLTYSALLAQNTEKENKV